MTKKQRTQFIFKWIGIGAGIAVGFIGLVCAWIGITGGFNPKIVEPDFIAFSTEHTGYQPDSNVDNPLFVIDSDEFFVIAPNPLDSTELDANLKIASGAELVKDIMVLGENELGEQEYVSAELVKPNVYKVKMGEKFKLVLSDEALTISKRVIEFNVDHELTTCKAQVFVDSALVEYKLSYEKINGTTASKDNFFPGDSLYVCIDKNSISPTPAFSQSSLSSLTNKFKYIEYEIDNQDVAEFEKDSNGNIVITYDSNNLPRVKVNIKKDGAFKVTSHICNTYLNEEKIISNEAYNELTIEERKAYDTMLYGGEDEEGNKIIGFMVKSELQMLSRSIEVGSMTARSDTLICNLFQTYRFDASSEGLNISINPTNVAGSHYTPSDLAYLISDVEIVGGYFVSDGEGDVQIELANGTIKSIKKSNRYLDVKKEVGAGGNVVWAISVNDFYSNIEPSNCLLLSLTYTITSLDDQGQVVQEDNTIYTFVPLTIQKQDIPNFKIKLDSQDSPAVSLTYNKDLEEQTDSFNLDNAKLVLTDSTGSILSPEQTLSESTSPYKKTIYVTKQDAKDLNYTLANEVFKITSVLFGDDSNKIIPVGSGTAYLYAIVVKTNKQGEIVDKDNVVIEDSKDILTNCVVLYVTSSVSVNVHQELEILPTNIISLYNQDKTLITDDDENYEIEKVNGEITAFKLYIRSKVYVKLNVNDSTAFKNAYDTGKITFETGSNVITLGALELVGEDYMLPVTAINVLSDGSATSIIIRQNGEVQYSLQVTTLDYILKELNIESNATGDEQNGIDSIAYLSLSGQSAQSYWTVEKGLSKETPLTLTITKTPSQATIIGEVNYKIYILKNPDFDLSSVDELTQAIIDENFEEDSSIIQLMEDYPQLDEKQNDILRFNIKKAGKAIFIASYTRIEDGVTIFSKPHVISCQYPNFVEQNYNYGNEGYYETLGDENYRILVTSFDGQKTNLLNFIGVETSGDEKVEGKKIGLDWKYANEADVPTTQLYAGLYNFEIVSITGSQTVVKEDFSFSQEVITSQVVNYLVTPTVDSKVYIKIKIFTPFGYEFAKTYNYVLVPDYTLNDSNLTVDLNSENSSVELFKTKFNAETKQFENNGGKLFITNNPQSSNYVYGNEDKLTAFEGDIVSVLYLPYNFDASMIHGIDALTEIARNNDESIITYSLVDGDKIYYYELRFVLSIAPQNDELALVKVDKGTISIDITKLSSDITIPVSILSIAGEKTETITTIKINGKV